MSRPKTARTVMRRVVLVVLAAVMVVGTIVVGAPPAVGQDGADRPPPPDPAKVERRELLVVDKDGVALDGGGSSTMFGLVLEGDDECPGDSQTDQYRVDSYMVPLDVDPSQLAYAQFGPLPPTFRKYDGFQMPLYKADKDPYAAELTARQIAPGDPGPIPRLPAFVWDVYVPRDGIENYKGGLPPGAYRIGIACTFASRVTNLWETTIEITPDAAEEPVGIAWKVTGPQPLNLLSSSDSGPSWFVYALIAFGAVMALVAVVLRRSSRQSPHDGADAGEEAEPGGGAMTPEGSPA